MELSTYTKEIRYMKKEKSNKKYLAFHPAILALACINISLDCFSRIGMNLDGVFKFYNALNFNIKQSYNVQTYLFNTPYDYTSRNIAEFGKAIPIWISYSIGVQDFQILTYIWSGGLSLLNWSALLGTLYLVQKNFQLTYFYIICSIVSIYAITLTSYLDSTLNFAIFCITLLYALSRDLENNFWKLLMFFFVNIAATSIHEIMLPLLVVLNCSLGIQFLRTIKHKRTDLAFFCGVRILISVSCLLVLSRHYLKNREVYTTVGNALSPNFLNFESYKTHPRTFIFIIEMGIAILLILGLKEKRRIDKFYCSLLILLFSSIPILVLLDYTHQNRAPRRPFLEYQYRSDYSVLIIAFIILLALGGKTLHDLRPKFDEIRFKRLINLSMLIIVLSNSITHIHGSLNWRNCWIENIEANRSAILTTNEYMFGDCNSVAWTTLMTSIVYSNNRQPSNFIISQNDLLRGVSDPINVQNNGSEVIFPFGLNFPIRSPGLDLSLLPTSR
jgi:hypothetical protein